jgi:SAM-dependent methyltransferase
MDAPVTDAVVSPEAAAEWIARWDAQQEGYMASREERFAVMVDVVAAAVAEAAKPTIVDLGCGPGSLTARLSTRLPAATFVGVDADPVLLGLARAHYGAIATWLQADLTTSAWVDALPAPLDVAVSTTALHWLRPEQLAELYRTLAAHTRPGGVFVNGDHLALADARLEPLGAAVTEGDVARAGVGERENWSDWWSAALADARLALLAATRGNVAAKVESTGGTDGRKHDSNRLSVTEHVALLREAGYTAAAPLWQVGDDHVIAAVR